MGSLGTITRKWCRYWKLSDQDIALEVNEPPPPEFSKISPVDAYHQASFLPEDVSFAVTLTGQASFLPSLLTDRHY